MAQKVEVRLIDDIDGTDAAETVTFALDGKAYEIDLNSANADQMRDVLEPYRAKARRAGTQNLRAKGIVFTPHRANTIRPDDSAKIRDWAKRYGLSVNERGRVNQSFRDAYDAFQDGNRGPLDALLKEHGIDPEAADAAAKTISEKPTAPKSMSVDDRSRLSAKQAGRLSSAQLTRLRKAYATEDGICVSDGRSGDTTSYEALANRGLMTRIEENTYEITTVGQLWFEVHGISPTA